MCSPAAGTQRSGQQSWSTAGGGSVRRRSGGAPVRGRAAAARASRADTRARAGARGWPLTGAAGGCLGVKAKDSRRRRGHGLPRPMGLGGPSSRAGAGAGGPERVGPWGSARSSRIDFSFF
jgi:hypothetical protein